MWGWALASPGDPSLVVNDPTAAIENGMVLSRAGLGNRSLIVDTSSLRLDVDYQFTIRITGPALATPLTASHTVFRTASTMPDVILSTSGPYLSASSTTVSSTISSPCSSAPVPDLAFLWQQLQGPPMDLPLAIRSQPSLVLPAFSMAPGHVYRMQLMITSATLGGVP